MSEWGRLQDSLHDHFDEQGVTGVDVDKLIEHLVNVRDFFPGLLGAGRSSDPEPLCRDPRHDMIESWYRQALELAAPRAEGLRRPSDERVPESECKRFRHDEHCDHFTD